MIRRFRTDHLHCTRCVRLLITQGNTASDRCKTCAIIRAGNFTKIPHPDSSSSYSTNVARREMGMHIKRFAPFETQCVTYSCVRDARPQPAVLQRLTCPSSRQHEDTARLVRVDQARCWSSDIYALPPSRTVSEEDVVTQSLLRGQAQSRAEAPRTSLQRQRLYQASRERLELLLERAWDGNADGSSEQKALNLSREQWVRHGLEGCERATLERERETES